MLKNVRQLDLYFKSWDSLIAIWQETAIAKRAFGIACGAMDFPPEIAARIALETVSNFFLSSLAIGSVVLFL